MTRTKPPKTRVERSLLEVEGYLSDFADDNPHVVVTLMRFSNVLGTDIVTPVSRALELPLVPCIAGFDPLVQFTEEDDVVRAIQFVITNRIPGIYNVAGDSKLPWSEVVSICGKRRVPISPIGTGQVASLLELLRVTDMPPEFIDLLRHGRGVDNRRLKKAGFVYRYTSAGTVENFVQASRLRKTVGQGRPAYRYERDVENFFRHSPAVVREDEG
jgi:UDP-glucose 4-epimerase